MRATGSVWILLAAASLAVAQIPASGVSGTNPPKPAGVRAPAGKSQPPARAAGEQKKGILAALVTKPAPGRRATGPARPAPRLVLKKGAAKPISTPASISGEQGQPGAKFAGKRDPFVSIIREVPMQQSGCVAGKKCLVISQINLKGVVHSGDDKFAVVEDGQKRTFFLRENDPVFNGQVVRITNDEVLFRETVMDRAGRTFPREIVKKLPKG